MKVDISYQEDGTINSKIEIVAQDVWNVDVTCSHLIAALLRSFIDRTTNNTIPGQLERIDALKYCKSHAEIVAVDAYFDNKEHWSTEVADVWRHMLEAMHESFKTYNDFNEDFDSPKSVRHREARMLFMKYFENLWD
jgi:hypothetical protein